MNERIKDLAEQAGHRYIPSSNSGPLRVEYLTPELEKFAELLIKECRSIIEAQNESLCDDVGTWSDRDFGYYEAVNDSVSMIKEHFGVEE